ncbi:orotidine 5'-phosphate decarboxylase / HUMPS family protein [Promicromonospora sp. NPDC023805]|uniref:orotidine 5'-phosphate decarboxylase / HUMPS family protein n=1 Tax=Promicromonospora sp. NPDC023805 TaxID=3154696 RepID=UPI0033C2EF1A
MGDRRRAGRGRRLFSDRQPAPASQCSAIQREDGLCAPHGCHSWQPRYGVSASSGGGPMVAVVGQWTGREMKALRLARRLSQRQYAAHLGLSDVALSSAERKGTSVVLRMETQQILDTDFEQAPESVRERFWLLLDEAATTDLAAASAARTAAATAVPDWHLPDDVGTARLREFIESDSRVFVLCGAAGTGKSTLVRAAASALADVASVQIHLASTAGPEAIAADILRYGSAPAGPDALLTLEQAASTVTRPLIVVLDGINTAETMRGAGHAVDAILRQTPTAALRFILAIRTPPTPDLSGYPLLAAALFGQDSGSSYTTSLWTSAAAALAWDEERQAALPAFAELPPQVKDLVRLPMFMSMARDGAVDVTVQDTNPYLLVRQFVRATVARSGHDVDEVIRVLGDAAVRDLSKHLPRVATWHSPTPAPDGFVPPAGLAQHTAAGTVQFSHDLVREYFAAAGLERATSAHGRSRLVEMIRELSLAADGSAVAVGLHRFFVMAVDEATPGELSAVALAPGLAGTSALARLLDVAAAGMRFATLDVLRACARTCAGRPDSLPTARALLRNASLPDALADGWHQWLFTVLHDHGSHVWGDLAEHVAALFDGDEAAQFVQAADLDAPEVAAFLARHVSFFITPDDRSRLVDRLLAHRDWRVRAAVAAGLAQVPSSAPAVARGLGHLLSDRDYKVRAAGVALLRPAPEDAVTSALPALLDDDVWYVRSRALEELARRDYPEALVRSALARCRSQDSWRRAPRYVRDLIDRLSLLCDDPERLELTTVPRAVVPLLREVRTGALAVLPERAAMLAGLAARSGTWLSAREGKAAAAQIASGDRQPGLMTSEAYRRLRGGRNLQVALDVADLDLAVAVAQAAAGAGARFIEVGDPLIKANGVFAIETVKRAVPDAQVVAEMMSSDWGRDQVENAVECGADVVLLIGPATHASVAAACAAARRLGTSILLDAPAERHSPEWVREMARAGVDGLVVTTNIDLGPGGREPLLRARQIRAWTQLPVAVSGGFTAADPSVVTSPDWDILIAGRAVTESADPHRATAALTSLISQTTERNT